MFDLKNSSLTRKLILGKLSNFCSLVWIDSNKLNAPRNGKWDDYVSILSFVKYYFLIAYKIINYSAGRLTTIVVSYSYAAMYGAATSI